MNTSWLISSHLEICISRYMQLTQHNKRRDCVWGVYSGKEKQSPPGCGRGPLGYASELCFYFPVPNKSLYFLKSISILYCWSHRFFASQTTREDKESIHTQLNEAWLAIKHRFDFPLRARIALMTQVDASTNELHPTSSWSLLFLMVVQRKTFKLGFICHYEKNKEGNIFPQRGVVHVTSLEPTIS